MFQKHEIIFSESIGVCQVVNIVNLSAGQDRYSSIPYYYLRSVLDKNKVSYIPVQRHAVLLRPLITLEEAKRRQLQWENLSAQEKEEIEYILRKDVAQ